MAGTCSFDVCERVVRARGLCSAHCAQWYRGKPLSPIDTRFHGGMTDQERLDEKTDKSGACWVWLGGKYSNGYGQFRLFGRKTSAHRAAYILANGSVDPLDDVDHMCRNISCVRPDHLQAVSRSENLQNRGAQSNSLTGVRGVSRVAGSSKYRIRAKLRGVEYHGGVFDSIAEANIAAIALRNKLHSNNLTDGGKHGA